MLRSEMELNKIVLSNAADVIKVITSFFVMAFKEIEERGFSLRSLNTVKVVLSEEHMSQLQVQIDGLKNLEATIEQTLPSLKILEEFLDLLRYVASLQSLTPAEKESYAQSSKFIVKHQEMEQTLRTIKSRKILSENTSSTRSRLNHSQDEKHDVKIPKVLLQALPSTGTLFWQMSQPPPSRDKHNTAKKREHRNSQNNENLSASTSQKQDSKMEREAREASIIGEYDNSEY